MWHFKKKKEYDISSEDRFVVTIKQDKNEYYIAVSDRWSQLLFTEEKNKENRYRLNGRTATMGGVTDYNEVLNQIKEIKNYLRKKFIKARAIQCEPKKNKKSKKAKKTKSTKK